MEALNGRMDPLSSITIPSEIITEILYRLPTKSIARFRCVSKGWLSQLTEPQFIKTHQNTLNQNHLIFTSCNDHSLYSLPFHQNPEEEEEEEATLSTPTKLRVDLPRGDICVQGCCNGLVLLSYFWSSYSLVILNPTTGKFVKLPDLNYDMEGVDYEDGFMFGFPYDSVTDDYKVVVLTRFHDQYEDPPDDVSVDVYSLKNNTWNSVMYYPFNFCGGMRLLYVDGCLHWLATKGSKEVPVIVAFSLKDDKFRQMALPIMGIDIYHCNLANLGGKLAILEGVEGAVWLMNEYGVKESWTKILLHGFNDSEMVEPVVFDVHGKMLVLISWYKMWIYNLEDGSLCTHVDTSRYWKGLMVHGICVESLVPLPKVHLDESTDSSEG